MASKAQTEDAGLVKSRHSGAYGLFAHAHTSPRPRSLLATTQPLGTLD